MCVCVYVSNRKASWPCSPGPCLDFPDGSMVKNPPDNAGDIRDVGSIPESGTSPGGVHGNPLQYSCLDSLADRGAWQATVLGVAELDITEVT